ncbi:hypothetical protein [Zavarzinia compransoris]|uniref:Uncharacterized protein n=1 Tax=Zavarzinia compransoris TaxID=1264899 RepID=A0A317ECW6_9PROT|nr:hypothetical protein [Zavarzinia compransoris]PWR23980.1 hypothetical protein DKG75_05405 [Zavarzinia compransoris]TDP48237.1 hypothetical protein DES42_102540 [Zavarzinia compransoris]
MIGFGWLKKAAGVALLVAGAGVLGGCVVYDGPYDHGGRRYHRGYEGDYRQGPHHHGGPQRPPRHDRGGYYHGR